MKDLMFKHQADYLRFALKRSSLLIVVCLFDILLRFQKSENVHDWSF